MNELEKKDAIYKETGIIQVGEDMLMEARNNIDRNDTISVPISELSSLGPAVASIMPSLNIGTNIKNVAGKRLFEIPNLGSNDVFKKTQKRFRSFCSLYRRQNQRCYGESKRSRFYF